MMTKVNCEFHIIQILKAVIKGSCVNNKAVAYKLLSKNRNIKPARPGYMNNRVKNNGLTDLATPLQPVSRLVLSILHNN